MAAPTMPRSAAPNYWLSSSVPGTTLIGNPTKNNQLAANATNVTLIGGPLDDTFIAFDPGTVVVEAPAGGIDTVVTYGSGYTLRANVENLMLKGTANSFATGNAGDNLIIGNDGSNRITTGGGDDVVTGGNGTDRFVITRQAGATTWITDLATGTAPETIELFGYGFRGFAEVKAAMSQVGTDVRIDLGSGQSLMLANKTVAAVTAKNIAVENSTAGLHLTFHDEFNSLSLNTGTAATAGNTWKTTFFGGERTLAANKELELYVDRDYKGTAGQPLGLDPFSIENGVLSISARPADAATAPYLNGFKYTSGLLTTQTSFSQTYGYYEIRAQTPAGKGLWPAFWLLSADGKWPPEIDVMEQIGSQTGFNSNGVASALGGPFTKGTNLGVDASKGFHTYAMDWTAQTITFYFDGKQTYQIATPADLHKPMYLLINLAVGGTWPGSPDATTDWSHADFQVDYVRAYSHDPLAAAAPIASVSNVWDALDLSSAKLLAATGPGTSKTYTLSELGLSGSDPTATVTVAYDSQNGLSVTNNGVWNAIKNAIVNDPGNGSVKVRNFLDVEITLGDGDSFVSVTDAKRGTITTGQGNDTISVDAYSNATYNNVQRITSGGGEDRIAFTGASNTTTVISAGAGHDRVTISGGARATIDGGAGDDHLIDRSTGKATLTGGAGRDLFEFTAGVHATITDFLKGEDVIQLIGIPESQVAVSTVSGVTRIDLGGGAQIQLPGVTANAADLDMIFG